MSHKDCKNTLDRTLTANLTKAYSKTEAED